MHMAQAYGHITQEQDEEEDRGGERMNYGGSGRNTGISLGLFQRKQAMGL